MPAMAAAGFTPEQILYLTNDDPKHPQGGWERGDTRNLGAELKAQYIYHFFKKDRDPHLIPPPWVDQTLDAMLQHAVWRDPEEGILNEAQLWQQAVRTGQD